MTLKGNKMKNIDYKQIPYITLDELIHSEKADAKKKYKVRAFISDISGPDILLRYEWFDKEDLDDETKKYFSKILPLPLYKITIQDEHGTEYKTKFFTDENMLVEFRKSMRSPVYKDFIVRLFIGHKLTDYQLKDKKKGELYLMILDVLDASKPLQQLQASEAEIEDIKKVIIGIQNTSSIFDYLKKQIVTRLSIKGLNSFPELDKAIDLSIVQAFSTGMINNNSGKIHSLIIGPPGTGKKLVTMAISCLQPVFHQADSMKISMPGVVGSARYKGKRWSSEPGLIPLSNNGAFVIQDFHAVQNSIKRELYGTFSMVMEDGEVADSTVAKQRHQAIVTIHIDMNKLSDIYLSETVPYTPHAKLKDIQLPLNILTRFDAIIELERDAQRQLKVALDMHSQPPVISSGKIHEKDKQWSREAKLIVGYIIENYFSPKIAKGVLDYIKTKQSKLFEENKNMIDRLSIVGDYQTRLSNSIYKYVFAIARMNLRNKVYRQDVDFAFSFVEYKFKFIKSILDKLKIPSDWDKPIYNMFDSLSRRQFIEESFKYKEFTLDDVVTHIEENYGDTVKSRTIYRDLGKVAKTIRKNGKIKIYKIK